MSCLFDSLTHLLREEFDKFHDDVTLRQIVCEYIEERPNDKLNGCKLSEWIKMINENEFNNITDYADRMRNDSEWGGAPEMSIVSKLFKVEIHVIHKRKVISKFKCCKNPHCILVLLWDGSHYEPKKRISK